MRLRILVGQLLGAPPPPQIQILMRFLGRYSAEEWVIYCDGYLGYPAEEWLAAAPCGYRHLAICAVRAADASTRATLLAPPPESGEFLSATVW